MKEVQEAIKLVYKALDDKFGIDIVVLDISEISIVADYFVVASGNNSSQVKAMADETLLQLQKAGIKARHYEGYHSANWILLDFGSIIVHIFDKDNRLFYNLERVWGDAKRVNPQEL